MAFNIEKYNKVKKELEQKANLLNRMEQEMKAEKRKEDAARKIKVGAELIRIVRENNIETLDFANDISLLVGALTNNLILKRIHDQREFLRVEGDKRLNEWKLKNNKKGARRMNNIRPNPNPKKEGTADMMNRLNFYDTSFACLHFLMIDFDNDMQEMKRKKIFTR